MRGRKPKPAEQRRLEGNPGKRPLPDTVIVAGRPDVAEMAEPPDYLPEDGKDFWSETVAWLIDLGIVDRIDRFALEQVATQYARIRQAQRVIKADGHFARGSTGQLVEHPALKIERSATDLFLKLAEHYALTPIARTRLGLAELQARSLASELQDVLGEPEVVDDDDEDVDEVEVVD
jgi:P27 family predicted phage terminase small subunit